ncbi:MAG: YdiU family protein, partial [Burkholderiales bacterium]|nr:YdiU family protein [Burkholderiales bacterium]
MAEPSSLAALRAGCSFASLPRGFYAQVDPRPLRGPRLLHANPDAAALIGLDAAALRSPEFLALCSGGGRLGDVPPLATAYSGHQFGVWAGQLGDGRAHLLGDVRTPGGAWEIQLKGSGRTPYSRMGDGWAVLRSSVREYLASEAMAGLGIPTTRALALAASDDPVVRETVETAAVVTRLAPSFVRFGHFEHWGHSHHEQKALLDYVVDHWYPECLETAGGEADVPATACRLLAEVTRRTARLIAQWQLAGFCHGVMNTDNMSILGLTLDYGPYGFMDAFQADHVCNHSDTAGRYAWNAQPAVARWNLYRLAGSLLVLGCEAPSLEACLAPFEAEFLDAYRAGLARKLGLDAWRPDDAALEDDWWNLLHAQRAWGAAVGCTAVVIVACELARMGFSVAILDADPQLWISKWHERLAERAPASLSVVPYVTAANLGQHARKLRGEVDFLLIDLPGARSPLLAQALGYSNYVLIPVQGSAMDAEGATNVIELLQYLEDRADIRIPHSVVLTRV